MQDCERLGSESVLQQSDRIIPSCVLQGTSIRFVKVYCRLNCFGRSIHVTRTAKTVRGDGRGVCGDIAFTLSCMLDV